MIYRKGYKSLIYLIGYIALTGCTTTRYVQTPCLTPEQWQELHEAEPPKVAKKLTGKADEDIRVVAGSAVRLRAWGQGLLGVLQGCRG